jgi:hypothetical protein
MRSFSSQASQKCCSYLQTHSGCSAPMRPVHTLARGRAGAGYPGRPRRRTSASCGGSSHTRRSCSAAQRATLPPVLTLDPGSVPGVGIDRLTMAFPRAISTIWHLEFGSTLHGECHFPIPRARPPGPRTPGSGGIAERRRGALHTFRRAARLRGGPAAPDVQGLRRQVLEEGLRGRRGPLRLSPALWPCIPIGGLNLAHNPVESLSGSAGGGADRRDEARGDGRRDGVDRGPLRLRQEEDEDVTTARLVDDAVQKLLA